MPFDPNSPFDPADPSQLWWLRNLPRTQVQPNAPPNAASGSAAESNRIDVPEGEGFPNDWFVPEADGYPNDWFVPGADGFPNDRISPDNPNAHALAVAPPTAPQAPSPPPNAAKPVPSNRPAARFDPYEAYWSQIPASRVGAMAWHPPIFLSADPLSRQNMPAFVWGTSPPFLPSPFGQFPSTANALPDLPTGGILGGIAKLAAEQAKANDPWRLPEGGILGGIPKLCAASGSVSPWPTSDGLLGEMPKLPPTSLGAPNPWDAAPNGLLGGITNLSAAASAPWGVPSSDTAQGLFAPLPSPFSDPLPPGPAVGDRYPRLPLPGYLADPSLAPLSQSTDASESPTVDKIGILPPDLTATPLATTAAASSAGSDSSPSADGNPLWSFLNALNPISPAFAADDEGWGWPPVIAEAVAQGLIDAATAKRLTERAKVLQNAQDAFEDLRDIVQDRPSPRALGRALEASGVSRPAGYEAHHIVAGNHKRAAVARDILKTFKIGINDPANGVFLPADESTQLINGEAIHASLHTKGYFEAVEEALKEATSREEAIAILRRIGQALQSRTFP
jgi:hypothetical protein